MEIAVVPNKPRARRVWGWELGVEAFYRVFVHKVSLDNRLHVYLGFTQDYEVIEFLYDGNSLYKHYFRGLSLVPSKFWVPIVERAIELYEGGRQ
jgi:hypothetical protein